MCGIVACLGPRDIAPAIDSMRYRGTQPPRIYQGQAGSVAHVRLPVVGLSDKYSQPVEIGRQVIAFVGEVLDFRDMHPEAESDLPLVIDSWRKYGNLTGHDGFWSVVILDQSSESIYAFCDYLAQKPLYYREDLLTVASEIAPLAAMEETSLDEIYLSACVKWGYCPETWRTPYREIKKILPGCMLTLAADDYVRVDLVDPLIPRKVSPLDLKIEIEKAVKRRVVAADIPISALVSGGLDSAIVYTLASRDRDVHAYHVENGEAWEASLVVGGGEATLLDYWDASIEKALGYMQEPIDLGSLLPQVALSDAIARQWNMGREHMCLTGDGADELFGGYGRAKRYDSQASDVWHELVAWHLPRLDRTMMRNTIEVRSPFLARRVVEAALGLPWEMRQDKKILRDLFRGDLPEKIADLPKRPLRTKEVEVDREGRSRQLVDLFRQAHERFKG